MTHAVRLVLSNKITQPPSENQLAKANIKVDSVEDGGAGLYSFPPDITHLRARRSLPPINEDGQ